MSDLITKRDDPRIAEMRDRLEMATPEYWLIHFEDADMSPEIFTSEDAAKYRFEKVSENWNARLFADGNYIGSARTELPTMLDSLHAALEREIRHLDLIRYSRHRLHEDELITNEELSELLHSNPGHAAVARLEGYDKMRAERDAALKKLHSANEAWSETTKAARVKCHQKQELKADLAAAKAEIKRLSSSQSLPGPLSTRRSTDA